MEKKVKLHARVTREIEITQEQAERLVSHLCGCVEHADISDILEAFKQGITTGDYDTSYIPFEWVYEDLLEGITYNENRQYLEGNVCQTDDIEF